MTQDTTKSNRCPNLSITHNFCSRECAQLDVGQARQSAPHDDIAGRRIIRASEITAKPSDFDDVRRYASAIGYLARARNEAIEQSNLGSCQREFRRCIGRGTIEHCHPEDVPTDDAEDGDQVDETLRGPEFGILGPTAGFQDFVKHLDFPARCILSKFLDGVLERSDRQIGDQLPVDGLSAFRLAALLGMDHGQRQCGIMFLLSNRWQEMEFFELDLENGNARIAIGISNLNTMPAPDLGLGHVSGDRMIPVTRQAIDAGPHQEVGADLLCRAEEFVDVALAVADMDTARRIAQRCSGLPENSPASECFPSSRSARASVRYRREIASDELWAAIP